MVRPICENGKVCVFLKKKVNHHSSGFDYLFYACNNPKRFKEYQLPRVLTHKEKYGCCKCKVTDLLESFI